MTVSGFAYIVVVIACLGLIAFLQGNELMRAALVVSLAIFALAYEVRRLADVVGKR